MDRKVSVVERADAEGRAYFVLRWRDPDGRRCYHTLEPRCYSRREADVKAAGFGATLAPVERGVRPGPRPLAKKPLSLLLADWWGSHPGLTTRNQAQADVKTFLAETHVEYAADITATVIDDWSKARKGVGVEGRLRCLRSVLQWARDERDQIIDARVMQAAAAAQPNESLYDLMSDEQYQAIETKAARLHQLALIHCLALYGWRPVTACKLKIRDVDLAARTVRLDIKPSARMAKRHRRAAPQPRLFQHGIFPATVNLLRPLIEGRLPDEPVFLNQFGGPWKLQPDRGSAQQMTNWYRANLQPLAEGYGGMYMLKRYAINRMHEGHSPWRRPQSLKKIATYTGHKTLQVIERHYLRPDLAATLRDTDVDEGDGFEDTSDADQDGMIFVIPEVTASVDSGTAVANSGHEALRGSPALTINWASSAWKAP